VTFGQVIADARKKAGLSQKDLASRIKKEDGTSISAQYLNDIERDRRNPPSEHLIVQFANELGIDLEVLMFVIGQLPHDVRGESHEPEQIRAAFRAFRQTLRGDRT
jgi:transcriptional regulator with XRE-family HTH domain